MKRVFAMLLAWLMGMQLIPAKELTMNDVRELAAMGPAIEWSDLAPYGGTDIGSGLCILSIPVSDEPYKLWAGMDRLGGEILYLILVSNENSRSRMELWTEDIDDFLAWDHRIGRFRFDRVEERYSPGEAGVNPFPFRNTQEAPVFDYEAVVDRAREEVTVEYNAVELTYDPAADVWNVLFYKDSTSDEIALGGGQNVYLGSDGVTRLIVYDE